MNEGDNLSKRIAIEDPQKALPSVIAEMIKQKPDLMVLLSHASLQESRDLAQRFPEFKLILSAGGPEDPIGKPEFIGKTMLVASGQKTKHVGVVGFFPDDKQTPLRLQSVELDRHRFKDSDSIVELMREYQSQLFDLQLAATELPIRHPSGARFVGAEKCGECHSQAYEKWENSKHSHAFESLTGPREGLPDFGTRIYDAECLTCHVTGWDPQQVLRYDSGFINEKFARNDAEKRQSQLLKSVQCESCHGAGSRHVELYELDELNAAQEKTARNEVRVTLEQSAKSLCITCHDYDNSPKFKFDKYWPEIEHPGVD